MFKKIKEYIVKNNSLCLFICFFLLYLFLGICFSYVFSVDNAYNFLFEADTPRIIEDFSNIFGNHYRTVLHPLIILLVQPIILFMIGITQDKILSIVIFSSIIGALQVLTMYKTILVINKNSKISTIISIIFGLSFSNIIFNSGIELYNIAALFLQFIWYLVISVLSDNKNIDKNFLMLFCICGVFSLGITVTNYIVFLIACLVLLISRKINLKTIFKINVAVIIIFIVLNIFQNFIWNNTPIFLNSFSVKNETSTEWVSFVINSQKIKNLISDGFINNVFGSGLYLNTSTGYSVLTFEKVSSLNLIFTAGFYFLIGIVSIKNFKKNLWLNLGIISCIIFNGLFHLIYGNDNVFLYSQHFNYLIFLLLGINLLCNKNSDKKVFITLLMFSIYGFINNIVVFKQLLNLAATIMTYRFPSRFLLPFVFLILPACCILMGLIVIRFNKIITKEMNISSIVKLLILIICTTYIFISIKTFPQYKKWMGINLDAIVDIDIVKTNYNSFKHRYGNEVKQYKSYIKEYQEFVKANDVKLVDINENSTYYLFGFADRKKIIYVDGQLKDVSNNILYEWKVEEELIIPNIYTVLLKTYDDKYIKIYEDNDGIHIVDGKDVIIDGTNKKINLYKFGNEKYSNILKVLYGEILFNIKNGKIYPNIIVYDNVWYRDAAITSMVLKYTNNIDLIENWINSIDDIYDMQNAGNKEPDNLGEVLFLKSLVKNVDEKVINKIINEAETLATNNPKGKYLYGLTDGANLSNYQTTWYKFGLNSLGIEYYFDENIPLDSYSSTTWWQGNCSNGGLTTPNYYFPYLSWAQYHCIGTGEVYLNKALYPLSWEQYASEPDYTKLEIINSTLAENNLSPTHTWSASEIFMYIVD